MSKAKVRVERPKSDYPQLVVHVPSSWPYVILEPIYDAHWGHSLHASKQFLRDIERIAKSPYTLTWNGGDLIENAVLGSPGIFSQNKIPQEQFDAARELLEPLLPKMLFAIPGNHEARTARVAGFDIAKALADILDIPYFADYCFLTILWRGNRFRGLCHHGSGGAQTPGGQRNAARKDLPWAKADFHWTGHLHQSMVDLVYQADHNQKTGGMFSRQALVIISPSYLKYFGGYAAAKRYSPGTLGTVPVVLREDGRMEATVSAKGRRL